MRSTGEHLIKDKVTLTFQQPNCPYWQYANRDNILQSTRPIGLSPPNPLKLTPHPPADWLNLNSLSRSPSIALCLSIRIPVATGTTEGGILSRAIRSINLDCQLGTPEEAADVLLGCRDYLGLPVRMAAIVCQDTLSSFCIARTLCLLPAFGHICGTLRVYLGIHAQQSEQRGRYPQSCRFGVGDCREDGRFFFF